MSEIEVLPAGSLGRNFISGEHIPEGRDEYYLRNEQSHKHESEWRNLRADEIETLVKNGNNCDQWDDILVTNQFDPTHVRNCEFHGLVRIGRLDPVYLGHHDLTVPVGLTNSRIISCDIGDNVAIHHVRYLAHYIIGDHVILQNLDEMHCSNHASSPDEPSQIGEGVELVNGIIGRGCHIFYGCKGVRFVLGQNSNLKYGARLIHSYLGANSTVSCCEILNNLIFPAHEQHHNNSFLVASCVMGQSNIAACATLGSNHNSRAPDGEIHAGRGFWPGLCVSVKHNCRFASFALVARGDYPAELDVPLPFCLLSNDTANDRLQLLPAYWWLYNMYALARNTWKFAARDRRQHKIQNIEFQSLAPDTAEEIATALDLLEAWTAKAHLRKSGEPADALDPDALAAIGRQLLTGQADKVDGLEILAEGVEHSRRDTVVLKAHAAYAAYREMLHHYAVRNLLDWLEANPKANLAAMSGALAGPRERNWVNLGGQLVTAPDLAALKDEIKSDRYATWDAIHEAYDRLWETYPLDKQRHAFATLLDLLGLDSLTPEAWTGALDKAVRIQDYVAEQTYLTRKKDYDNPFRRMAYSTDEEMEAVLGTAEDNTFVKQVREEAEQFKTRIEAVKQRG